MKTVTHSIAAALWCILIVLIAQCVMFTNWRGDFNEKISEPKTATHNEVYRVIGQYWIPNGNDTKRGFLVEGRGGLRFVNDTLLSAETKYVILSEGPGDQTYMKPVYEKR